MPYDAQLYWEQHADQWIDKMNDPAITEREWDKIAPILGPHVLDPEYRVVELGCGFGRFAPYFINYLGLDLARPLLAQAQNNNPTQHFQLWDYRQGLPTNAVDLIFSRTGLLQLSPQEIIGFAERLPKVDYLFIEPRDNKILHSHAHDYETLFNVKEVGRTGRDNRLSIFTNITTSEY